MFKVTKNGSNRLDIELSGKLDTEEMKIALDELEGALYPGLEIKAFDRDQKTEAEAWLSN